ncbi:MAG: zinc-ribbon domain-containing protein [Oscillospiraceae bacterium]
MFCNKCGTKLPDDSVFCSKCGVRLESKVSLNKEPQEETKPAPPPPRRPERLCRACYKPLTTKWKKCPYCDEPNPFYEDPNAEPQKLTHPAQSSQSSQPSTSVQPARSQAYVQSQSVVANVSKVCFIISIAALVIALFIEYVVLGNMEINSYEDLTTYNTVVLFDWFFCGVAILAFVIRVICAFILAARSGDLSGLCKLIGIGLVITIIAGAITKAWGGVFIVFGIVVAIYICNKIHDWM